MLRFVLVFAALLLVVPGAQAQESPPADKWEKVIAEFEQADRAAPPPQDAVLFVGSSSIRLWDLKQSFPELATINRGFGGSQMSDVVRHYRRLIARYRPRLIVLYEGDNDLNSKKSPDQVASDFGALLKLIRADLGNTPLVVIGCKPSPSRWKLIDQQRQLNRLLDERCRADGHAAFVDVEPAMLDDQGQPRSELFRKDLLHLNDEGYAVWTKLLLPLVAK